MLLSRLQHLLGGIYDVRIAHDVYDFLVTDRGRLPHAARSGVADEELLVAQPADGSDEVVMSLYLDPALLERLRREDPLRRLHTGNLADCWTALEGVSHFLYLAWNAGHDRAVSLLELEMQEVTHNRKSTRLNSSHGYISYAVFCLKKKNEHQ